MMIPDKDRFHLICSPITINVQDDTHGIHMHGDVFFYFADYDRRQGMFLALDSVKTPATKPWNEDKLNAKWEELVKNWLVKWADELDSKKDIFLIDWKESKPNVYPLDGDSADVCRAVFIQNLAEFRHYCHYPYLKETGFLDAERLRFKTSDLLEIERIGPNVDLVSFRDKQMPYSEKAFFKYAALPSHGSGNLREHWILYKHLKGIPCFEEYLHPVMDDTGKVLVGFLTKHFSGGSLRQNISRTFKLAHLQQLINAVGVLNERLKLLHNQITYDNILIDESLDKPKITDLGGVTPYDRMASDDVVLADVYALIRAIHAHIVRHPDEIEQFNPKALQETDTWEPHPLVRLGPDFEDTNPAEVCYRFLQRQIGYAATRRLAKNWTLPDMPSITRRVNRNAENETEVDLTTYWNRNPDDKDDFCPRPDWVRTPQKRLAECGAHFLANGKIATEKQAEELKPPSVPLDPADAIAWLRSGLLPDSSPARPSLLQSAQKSAAGTSLASLLGSGRKRRRASGDVGGEFRISPEQKEALGKLVETLREATELAKKAGKEAEEAAKEVKEAAEAVIKARDLVRAARKVAKTSLERNGPVPWPQRDVAWQI